MPNRSNQTKANLSNSGRRHPTPLSSLIASTFVPTGQDARFQLYRTATAIGPGHDSRDLETWVNGGDNSASAYALDFSGPDRQMSPDECLSSRVP